MNQVLSQPQILPFPTFNQHASQNSQQKDTTLSNAEQIKQQYEMQQALQLNQMSQIQLIMNMLPQFDEKANYYQEFVKVCLTNDFLHNQVTELFQDKQNLYNRIQELEKMIETQPQQQQQPIKQQSQQSSSQFTDGQLKKINEQQQQSLLQAQQIIQQHCRIGEEKVYMKQQENTNYSEDSVNHHNQDDSSEKQKKKNRRCATEIDKGYLCPYENCSKSYGSDVSLNLHIKIKHNGGSKTEREKLAKAVMLAKINKNEIPKLDIQFPPGYLENFEENLKKECNLQKSQSNYSSENIDNQQQVKRKMSNADQDSTNEIDMQNKKIKQE